METNFLTISMTCLILAHRNVSVLSVGLVQATFRFNVAILMPQYFCCAYMTAHTQMLPMGI